MGGWKGGMLQPGDVGREKNGKENAVRVVKWLRVRNIGRGGNKMALEDGRRGNKMAAGTGEAGKL